MKVLVSNIPAFVEEFPDPKLTLKPLFSSETIQMASGQSHVFVCPSSSNVASRLSLVSAVIAGIIRSSIVDRNVAPSGPSAGT